MAYIGREPQIGNFQVCDAISVVNNQAAYTMQVSSVNVIPETANHMLVSLNGVLQAPTSSYTVSGSTITFASNLVTGDVINFIQILGSVLDLGVPSDDTVSIAKLTATGTKNSTTFLRGDNTFAAAGGITQTDAWRITADTSTEGDITANWERSDAPSFGKIGSGLSQSSGIFTFPATGLYLVEYRAGFKCSSGSEYATTILYATINNSSYANVDATHLRIYDNEFENTARTQGFINCTNTSNVKVKFNWGGSGSNLVLQGDSDSQVTGASFIRLGDSV